MSWAEALQRSGDAAAARCVQREAPSTAFCIAGAARSFAAPLVQEALLHHLVRAYGGSSRSRCFFLLKSDDSHKLWELPAPGAMRFVAHRVSLDPIEKALRGRWTDWIGDAVIVNGSGAAADAQSRDDQALIRRVDADPAAWLRFRSKCVPTKNSTDPKTGVPAGARYLSVGTNEERLILNHLNSAWCRGAIERYEARVGVAFDHVVFARPDLLWYKPVTPWCQLAPAGAVHVCPRAGCDTMWVAAREHATALLDQARGHRDCTDRVSSASVWRVGRVELTTGCCVDSERLLWWTVRAHGLPANLSSLPPPGVQHGVLRTVHGVCETVFDEHFERWAFAMAKVSAGIHLPTALALRREFGHGAMCTFRNGRCHPPSNATDEQRKRATDECRTALGARPSKVHWVRAAGR